MEKSYAYRRLRLFPPDFALPMVAPADIGSVVARLLTEEADHAGVRYVEGPAPYSAADVAGAFADALGRDVRAVETPRSEWIATFRSLGFSPAAAASYARMTVITIDHAEPLESAGRGVTTLRGRAGPGRRSNGLARLGRGSACRSLFADPRISDPESHGRERFPGRRQRT
jgi:hypothetical protein